MVVSQSKGTPIWAPNTMVLSIGTPKRVPLILGNPHMEKGLRVLVSGCCG